MDINTYESAFYKQVGIYEMISKLKNKRDMDLVGYVILSYESYEAPIQ